jgi:large subunit ribosomal protein L31
MGCQG